MAAYRMPLYLPVSSTAKGHPLVVWGEVRPAPDAAAKTHRPQYVQIQFRAGSSGAFKTVQRVKLTNPHGFFEVHQTFAGTGQVRLRWASPGGPAMLQPDRPGHVAASGRRPQLLLPGSCYLKPCASPQSSEPATPSRGLRRGRDRRVARRGRGGARRRDRQPQADRDHPGQLGPGQRTRGDGAVPRAGRHHRARLPAVGDDRSQRQADIGAQALRRHRPRRLQRRQVGALRRDRPRRRAVRPDGRAGRHRRRPALGRGSRRPANYASNPFFAWKPNASRLRPVLQGGRHALRRQATPPRASAALPRIHFWSIWNEPNFGEDLGPQAIDGSSVSYAPMMYRSLVSAGWSALQQTGHGKRHGPDRRLRRDRARTRTRRPATGPQGLPGNDGQTHPIQFVRTPLLPERQHRSQAVGQRRQRGRLPGQRARPRPSSAPRTRACSTPPASPITRTPATATRPRAAVPTTRRCPDLGHLASTADAGTRAWGGGRSYQIYNDEYGYITNPPNNNPSRGYVSPATAAYYINWAEYLSWRNPGRRQLRPVPARRPARATTRSPAGWRRPPARRRRPTTPTGCRCTCPRPRSHAARR